MKINVHFSSYLVQFFVEGETFDTKVGRENQNTHFMFSNFFVFENRAVYEIMWKNIV